MKEHSGNGKSNNNNLDPTLDEHAAASGVLRDPKDDNFDIGGNVNAVGGKASPSGRGRGETSAADKGNAHTGPESR